MNPDIDEPAAVVAPVVNEQEQVTDSEQREFDIHEDPLNPPKGHRFLDYTKYGKVDATKTRKVPTVKRAKEPRKPGESLSGGAGTGKSISDKLSMAPTQAAEGGSKEFNMAFLTPIMQVQYSDMWGIGVIITGKNGNKSEPNLSMQLTTKPNLLNEEYKAMFESLPDVAAHYKNMKQNLYDFLLQTARYIFENDDVMVTEKNEAILAMQTQFKDIKATEEQMLNSVLQNIASKMTTPFPMTGDFYLKLTSASFFPVNEGKKAEIRPEILAMEKDPRFCHNPEIMKQISIIKDYSKPKPNPDPQATNKMLPAKNLHQVSYRFTEFVPEEIQALARNNPFFNPCPPGSLVSVNYSYLYTFYQDKFYVKLCPNNINIYYYNTISMFSGNYEQRPQPGFKPMKQAIPAQIANAPMSDADVPQTAPLPEAPNKWRRQEGSTDVHNAVDPTAIAISSAQAPSNDNNNNNNQAAAKDDFDGFDDAALNGLL